MQRSIAPISVIGAIGRAPYLAFNTEAEILETKEGKYLLRFRRDVRDPEWVTRDQFYVGGGSGDSDQAIESVARFSHGTQSTIPQGTPPGEPVTRNTKLKMGGAVYFQGGLGWENATILELTPRGARVHIDRHSSDGWDNVVDRALLRVPAK